MALARTLKRALLVSSLALATPESQAKPITLTCVDRSGRNMVDLSIDLDARTMNWAYAKFRIVRVDKRYITGVYVNDDGIGGEVWVQDRVSGKFARSGAGISFSSPEVAVGKLDSFEATGICSAPQF